MSASNAHSGPSRNALCPCGSRKKYKRCCGQDSGPGAAQSGAPAQLQQVIRHYQQGNLQAAAQLAEQQLKIHPDDATLVEITAAIALQTGNAELAMERFTHQVRLQPDNALAHSNLCMALHTLGRDEAAFLSGRQATELDPSLADAWNNLGNIYKSGNHLEGAQEHYEKALAIAPDDPEILVNAGAVYHLLGELDKAEQFYRRAIQAHSGFASAHNNLGVVLKHHERFIDAEQEFITALRLQPGNPEFLTNLGNLKLDQNDQKAAKGFLEEALASEPNYAGAIISIGNLLDQCDDQVAARTYYEKALLLDPENSTALCNIGYIMFENGDQQDAVDYFVRALKSNPNSIKGLAGLGKAMLREDRIDNASEYIHKALSLAPWDPHAHIAIATLFSSKNENSKAESEWSYIVDHWPNMPDGYIGLGNHFASIESHDMASATFQLAEKNNAVNVRLYHSWSQVEEHIHHLDEAERLARKAVELNPTYPGLKILQASLARRRKDYTTALDLLLQVDKSSIVKKQIRATYLFEFGNIHDKLGNYAAAYEAYEEANNIKNHYVGRSFNADEDKSRIQQLKDAFSKENWQKLSGLAADTNDDTRPQPIFIVGFPRSGTSLLEQILGSHPEITPAGELSFIMRAADTEAARILDSEQKYPALLVNENHPLDTNTIHTLRDFYLNSALKKTGATDESTHWITDKMPHNALFLGFIRILFPQSPIIHISRHPLNPCLSAYFSNFTSSHRYTSSLTSAAVHYRNMMEMLDHYRGIGIEFLEIHYEDLVNNQETITRQALDYIGAPWDEACLQHHKSKRVVRTASYEQVTQKVYTSSLNRYQNYWDAVQEIIPILQPTIEHFGYTVEPPPE